jgi:hypothetical protein
MNIARRFTLFAILLVLPGCYSARIETGLTPSTTQIQQKFASCWIYGLVPPKTVAAMSQCPNGVAIVETRLSFLNGLVGAITFGIYTPMEIVVTCATKPTASLMGAEVNLALADGASDEEAQTVFSLAADEAVRTGRPVCVWPTPLESTDRR